MGDPLANLERAIAALAEAGRVTDRSSFYRTAPRGLEAQPEFVNAVVRLETILGPEALLETLQGLERRLGRTSGPRWGPRTIDLDILTYDDLRLSGPALTIPHERMLERAFVLEPLAEIAPAYAEALGRLPAAERVGVRRVEGTSS